MLAGVLPQLDSLLRRTAGAYKSGRIKVIEAIITAKQNVRLLSVHLVD